MCWFTEEMGLIEVCTPHLTFSPSYDTGTPLLQSANSMFVPDIQLLHANMDLGDNQSESRIFFDGKFVRYLTIDAGIYDVDDMCFAPSLISMLPLLPTGDWNKGPHIPRHFDCASSFHQSYEGSAPRSYEPLASTSDRSFGASRWPKAPLERL